MNGTSKLGEVHQFGKLILSLALILRAEEPLPSLTETFIKRDQRSGRRVFIALRNRIPSNNNLDHRKDQRCERNNERQDRNLVV